MNEDDEKLARVVSEKKYPELIFCIDAFEPKNRASNGADKTKTEAGASVRSIVLGLWNEVGIYLATAILPQTNRMSA